MAVGRRPKSELTDKALYDVYAEQRGVNATNQFIAINDAIAELRCYCRDLTGKGTTAIHAPSIPSDTVEVGRKTVKARAGNDEQSYVWRRDPKEAAPQSVAHSTITVDGIDPAPKYETCPPASFNHLLEWHDGEEIDFIPFPDDPTFNKESYLIFAKPVAVEAKEDNENGDDDNVGAGNRHRRHRKKHARRPVMTELVFKKGLTYHYLNRNVRDDDALRETADALMEQYDIDMKFLETIFTVLFFLEPEEYHDIMRPARFYQDWQALSERVDVRTVSSLEEWTGGFMGKHSCFVPSCRIPGCVHARAADYLPKHLKLPARPPKPHTMGIPQSPAVPCGDHCYKMDMEGMSEPFEPWEGLRLAVLKAAVETYPEAPSCDLAIWCAATCREFEQHRSQLTPPMEIETESEGSSRPRRPQRAISTMRELEKRLAKAAANFGKRLGYPFSVACNHEGPCDSKLGCICFAHDKRCEIWCGCRKDCLRKHGCDCDSREPCDTENCQCYKEGRECDPAVCHGGGHWLGTEHHCCNVTFQEGKRPGVTVKPGTWGWGLFSDEPIKKGQFVGEYFGEYINLQREDREYAIATHIGRTYGFAATAAWSINSANIGNETRFMNHNAVPNVQAKHKLVNGDVRIGFYAMSYIRKNAEMFIHYGDQFPLKSSTD